MTLATHSHGDPTAPPLVLVHGLTDDGTCWPDAVARWSADWHVVAVDQRGHGASPRFTDEQLRVSPDVMEDDLLAVVQGLDQAPILVGHSLGGLMSARVGINHPELVRGLVLEDPAQPTGDWLVRPGFAEDQLRFVDQVTLHPVEERARMRRETPWPDAELDPWVASKAKVDRRYLREGVFLGDASWEELFSRTTVPTLLIGPIGGEMLPDHSRVTAPSFRMEVIPGVGHCVRRDDPDAFHAIVDPFLRALRS